MLGSLSSGGAAAAAAAAAASHELEEEEPSSSSSDRVHETTLQHRSPAVRMRQLLISCAELVISQSQSAPRLLSVLSSYSSPYGDSTERLVHQFAQALSLRFNNYNISNNPSTSTSVVTPSPPLIQSSYLSLNQITPFIRFSQLTANQAILEAVEGQLAVHILDFNIMHGVQWPPLMQALAERSNPPKLRITGTGHDLELLHRTGDRLLKFAQSLGLPFEFHPLLLFNNNNNDDDVLDHVVSLLYRLPSVLSLLPDEALAVNCVLYLHRLLNNNNNNNNNNKEDHEDLIRLFLHKIKALNPKVVTVAEREANHNHPIFLHRFVEALDHYTAIFDSLEATLPPNSQERLSVEQIWFGREIVDIIAAEEDNRRERHQRFDSWELMMRSSGFSSIPLSPFALSQAKLLLRLHYPSEGYHLHILNHSFFLGWQSRPLFSVSSWH